MFLNDKIWYMVVILSCKIGSFLLLLFKYEIDIKYVFICYILLVYCIWKVKLIVLLLFVWCIDGILVCRVGVNFYVINF